MALSGLEIYKLLPKTNCKKCGFPTCLAFAMALAQKKTSLDKCPDVTEEAKKALESASEPPIRLITIGSGDKKLEIGNETVMFRHEEKFHHPTGVGFLIEDSQSEDEIKKAVTEINKLEFERVGQKIGVNIIALKEKSDKFRFLKALKIILEGTSLPLLLISDKIDTLKEALSVSRDKNPLIGYCTENNLSDMANLAREYKVPLIVKGDNLDTLEKNVKSINEKGIRDIVIYTGEKILSEKIWDLTIIRRIALKKSFRLFGYPAIAFASSDDLFEEASMANTLVAKYAGICILKHRLAWQVLSILTLRQNIYTDPQKPLQVEPKLYEIGKTNAQSPVLITTNFSLTYYTVEAEVEGSKKPAFIISCDTEGMSVLTAWAAEKFTAESIAKALKGSGVKEKVSHSSIIIPGYVSVLSGKLEDESGWKVIVGPREASGIPSFLRNIT